MISLSTHRNPSSAIHLRKRILTTLRWIIILAGLIFAVFPIFWMINTSLKPMHEIFKSPPIWFSANPTLDSYISIVQERPIPRNFYNSIVVSVFSTLLAMIVSSLSAYGFTRFKLKLERQLILFILFTQMLPGTLLILPYFMMMSSLRLINNYISLILAYVSFAMPFSTWLLIGFFKTIPREIDEAALVDGCTPFAAFWRIVLPLSAPGLVAVGVFTFLMSWNSYIFALVLTTNDKMFPISVAIPNMVGEYQIIWNELMAAATLAVLPVILLYSFFERYLVQGLSAGAVKG